MAAQNLLNQMNACAIPEMNKILKTSDFKTGDEFVILKADRSNTTYGLKVKLVLEEGILFLPSRYTKVFNKEVIDMVNKSSTVIIFKGMHQCIPEGFQTPIYEFRF